jgi:hypothetical protein
MSRSLPQTIVNCLSFRDESSPVPWNSFGKREWEHALAWLDLSGLAVYFLDAVSRSNGRDALPSEVRTGLEERAGDNRRRTAGIVQELRLLSDSFTEAGVNYALLKGISLAPDYCPDPALRTQYDHDVLVDASSLKSAEGVLQSLGYRRKNANNTTVLLYRRPDPELRFSKTSEALYSSRFGRSVELHLTLWEEGEEQIRLDLPGDFMDRRQARRWDGVDYMALSDEDCLVFQVLHAFRHILRNWCRLSIFLEIASFLNRRSSDAAFWHRAAQRIQSIRWAPEASLVIFNIADQLFGAQIPGELRTALRTPLSPALNLWIEQYGQRSALSNFRRDKSSLFLHREFVDSPSAWSSIVRRRLFPIQRPHRPPAVVFQRGFSRAGKRWMEWVHALRRARFHALSGLQYFLKYPRWILLRRLRLSEFEEA